jgi:hypothetical protein
VAERIGQVEAIFRYPVNWNGTYPGQADPPVRVEMIQDRGRLIHFKVSEPWVRPDPTAPSANLVFGAGGR